MMITRVFAASCLLSHAILRQRHCRRHALMAFLSFASHAMRQRALSSFTPLHFHIFAFAASQLPLTLTPAATPRFAITPLAG
jgi:hypothetical protein